MPVPGGSSLIIMAQQVLTFCGRKGSCFLLPMYLEGAEMPLMTGLLAEVHYELLLDCSMFPTMPRLFFALPTAMLGETKQIKRKILALQMLHSNIPKSLVEGTN